MTSTEAFEAIPGRADAPLVLTCEHASERLPAPWRWPDEDARLRGTHWAFDPGAADLARELAAAFCAPAVLSRFSRLLVDPNRPETSDTLFRDVADGLPIALNASIDAADRVRRLDGYYRPYHAALDAMVASSRAPLVFAVHTFTPLYEGRKREVEVGVLFDTQEALAEPLAIAMRDVGFRVGMNEPWSGRGGFMYSPELHAQKHGRRAIEIELRQDLAVVAAERARAVEGVRAFLASR